MLDPRRVLLASTSNFGAPLARPGEPEGTILSIDPTAGSLNVPVGFAAVGGQASALGVAVQRYAPQNAAFLNSITEPQAITAALPSASLPLGISLNNGNGRPWIANSPNGGSGYGTITVRAPPRVSPGRLEGERGYRGRVHGQCVPNELGLTNRLEPRDELSGCATNANTPEVDAQTLQAAVRFLNTIDPPASATVCTSSGGAALFQSAGCANGHAPSLPGPGRQPLFLYSDLLLHEMGPNLEDGIEQGSALGKEFRTPPLWRVSERGKVLHDGRAATISDAIAAHGGQAQAARDCVPGARQRV